MTKDPAISQTAFLREDTTTELDSSVTYQPIPERTSFSPNEEVPVWRLYFEVLSDEKANFGLDINGEIHFGRSLDAANVFDLSPFGAESLGVSRRHMAFRPNPSNLYVFDLGSTNGTLRNGRSIGVNTPYSLADGDILTLGNLNLRAHILGRPFIQTTPLDQGLDLVDALSQIAKSITGQLRLEEVLNQVAATAMSLTAAGETSIWLVDEASGDLFLEAQRGIDDTKLRRNRIAITEDTPAARVLKTGQPMRQSNQPGNDHLQLMTGYFVEALAHVPISLGGVTFGVLAAAHREPGKQFDKRDEKLLSAIAEFAAIAIQNARLYEATDEALARRVKELSVLNEVSRTITASLDLHQVYEVLVQQVNYHWPVEAVNIYLFDEWQKKLRPLLSRTGHTAFPLNQGIIGQTADSRKIFVVNNPATHADYHSSIDDLNGKQPQSMACAPLIVKDYVVGVLVLYNKRNGAFTDEDIHRLEAFAYPIATAIENARLYEDSERQRAAIQATAHTLSEPIIILDENGNMLVSNDAANQLLELSMSQLFDAISRSVGRTAEVTIGEETYLSTTEHVPDVGTIIVMQDITYVKQLEKDRSEFMHMLSHDLKNPLTAVTGWAALLRRTVTLDEKSERYLNEVDQAADRMLVMINQLLDTVSQDELIQLHKQPCDLENIIKNIINDVTGAAIHKSIKLHKDQIGQPYLIEADETRLYHMVLNLVDNAIKYSPNNTNVYINTLYTPEHIKIQVQDEGAGIPEKDLPRVFDKYYRGIQEGLSKSGSGVGLAAVKNIVDAHGGHIYAKNGKGSGAIFTIELPGELRLNTPSELTK